MGVPKEQATRNRQAIVDAASRVFRERGVDGVGVADLMKEAGFTHGGFYNHFASKDALAAEACASAFAAGAATLSAAVEAEKAGDPRAFQALLDAYVSAEHCHAPGAGCPTATLAIDAARQGKAMQAAYAAGIEQFIEVLAPRATAKTESSARAETIATLIVLVGAIVLARGVGDADAALSEEILAVGRNRVSSERG